MTITSQSPQSSDHPQYTRLQVEDLANRLENLRGELRDERQKELLEILIAGAEWLLRNETKKQELTLLLEKGFKEAIVSALQPFEDRGGKVRRQECFSWGRSSTVGPK